MNTRWPRAGCLVSRVSSIGSAIQVLSVRLFQSLSAQLFQALSAWLFQSLSARLFQSLSARLFQVLSAWLFQSLSAWLLPSLPVSLVVLAPTSIDRRQQAVPLLLLSCGVPRHRPSNCPKGHPPGCPFGRVDGLEPKEDSLSLAAAGRLPFWERHSRAARPGSRTQRDASRLPLWPGCPRGPSESLARSRPPSVGSRSTGSPNRTGGLR
jgi:hypothetical protein